MGVTFSYRSDLGLNKRNVTAADIAEAERTLGVQLPQDFKDFLIAHDGPMPHPAWIRAATPQGAAWHGPVIQLLSTAGPKVRRLGFRSSCLEGTTGLGRDNDRLPAHYVVIGHLFTQPRMLLLSTAAADYGTVYASYAGDRRFQPDRVVRLAGSFTEFLEGLTDPPADVAAVFGRVLADTLAEMSQIVDDLALAHLRYAQALRNIRPFVEERAIQKMVDDGLAEANRISDEKAQAALLSSLISQVQDALRATGGRVADRERVAARVKEWDYDGPEARDWLRRNENESALATNHFGSTEAARKFVDELYALGADRVIVPETCIREEDDMGPYADALVVFPPSDRSKREAVQARCMGELDQPASCDVNDTTPVFLWWD
jgi:hypothetical protein